MATSHVNEPTTRQLCIGSEVCGLRCTSDCPAEVPALAEADPGLLAHGALSGLGVVTGSADTLVSLGDAAASVDGQELRATMRRQATRVGCAVGAMRERFSDDGVLNAGRWVAAACTLATIDGLSEPERGELLDDVLGRAPELAEELRDVVLGIA